MPEQTTWFELMWSNFYIQLFLIAKALLIGLIVDYIRTKYIPKRWFYVALSIPIMMMLIIGYFGFYLAWVNFK